MLLVSGCALYFLLTNIIKEETLDALAVNCLRTAKLLEDGEVVKSQFPVLEVKTATAIKEQSFKVNDTILFDAIENENILFWEVTYFQSINGTPQSITARSKSIENKDVFWTVFKVLLLFLLLILLILILLNRWHHKKIWAPFYENLQILKQYNLKSENKVRLADSNIDEFNRLNSILYSMMEQSTRDYQILKKFTENASHELQTPLSIIRNNTELIMQEDIERKISMFVEKIHQTSNRLTSLIDSLLLLSKIENNQFSSTTSVNINNIFKRYIQLYQEIFGNTLVINFEESADFIWEMNFSLGETLIKNLLENSIKHKLEGSPVFINVNKGKFVIHNASAAPDNNNLNEYFTRFMKGNPASDSPGLGLAIAKDICKASGLDIQAEFTNGHFYVVVITT